MKPEQFAARSWLSKHHISDYGWKIIVMPKRDFAII